MTEPVPKTLTRPLWVALVAGVPSLAVTTIEGVVRDGYDPWHQAVSALNLGPNGSIQMTNLVVLGAVILDGTRDHSSRRSVRPSGFAGTFERAAMVIPMIWTYAFLRRIEVK